MVTLQTTITNAPDDLAQVRDMVSRLERAQPLPAEVVFDINVVLDEVLSNILKYAYADGNRHHISVKLAASAAAIDINIVDDGVPFDPLTQPAPDLSLPLAERPIGGLGLHFVRNLVDEVRYERKNSRNHLFLKKNL